PRLSTVRSRSERERTFYRTATAMTRRAKEITYEEQACHRPKDAQRRFGARSSKRGAPLCRLRGAAGSVHILPSRRLPHVEHAALLWQQPDVALRSRASGVS